MVHQYLYWRSPVQSGCGKIGRGIGEHRGRHSGVRDMGEGLERLGRRQGGGMTEGREQGGDGGAQVKRCRESSSPIARIFSLLGGIKMKGNESLLHLIMR